MEKGKLIVFEGIEGSGKTVQTKAFYEALLKKGNSVVITEQPWEIDSIGKLIRRELKDKADAISVTTLQLLFIANRSNHVEKLILPSLKEGKIVVLDRYWMTTVAYGSTFSNNGDADFNYFMEINKIFPKPDVVFYVDVNPEIAYERITKNRSKKEYERFDKLDTLKLLHNNYRKLEGLYQGKWITINGNQEKDKVNSEIMDHYNRLFE